MPKTSKFAECAACGTAGPPGDLIPDALDAAQKAGWLTGKRPGSRLDYCPDCRAAHEPVPCTLPHHDAPGPAQALYRLLTDAGKELPSCGRHAPKLTRELFNGGAKTVTWEKIAAQRPKNR